MIRSQYKCDACGANLLFDEQQNSFACQYCGSIPTITKEMLQYMSLRQHEQATREELYRKQQEAEYQAKLEKEQREKLIEQELKIRRLEAKSKRKAWLKNNRHLLSPAVLVAIGIGFLICTLYLAYIGNGSFAALCVLVCGTVSVFAQIRIMNIVQENGIHLGELLLGLINCVVMTITAFKGYGCGNHEIEIQCAVLILFAIGIDAIFLVSIFTADHD